MVDNKINGEKKLVNEQNYILNAKESINEYANFTQPAKFNISKDDVLNVGKIKQNYHEQRLTQSKWAFWLSFWGSIGGFSVIIASIVYGIVMGDGQWPGIVAGAVIDGVSALFYTLSNKTNEKISEFFQELTKDSNIKDAIMLSQNIKDDNIKDELNVKLALHLSGISEERICKNTKEICNK